MADIRVINEDIEFGVALKKLPVKGNLVYEYNPFRNYRLNQDMIYYKDRLWTMKEFYTQVYKGTENPDWTWEDYRDQIAGSTWDSTKIPATETPPIVYQKGQLADFETDELSFSLNHPVNITPQWSYDNSVNLIINDGKNPPRLINSRFSTTERNKYQICDRKGNNDTNIYDQGNQFDIDTSLYRKVITIPKLNFLGVMYGGNLSVGNYHFYFRYVDEDGNESDFFAESGLVSIFIGNTPDSIRSGFRDENSHKMVKFFLSNTDPGYQKIRIYYSRATADIYQNAVVNYYKIDMDFLINQSQNTVLPITGFENVEEVTLEDINPMYQIYGSVETQDSAQNMLFLANVDKPEIPYNDLADCALRFLPYKVLDDYTPNIDTEYKGSATNNYYDPNFIYSKVGYWDDEIYRGGIVFIQSDNTLTPVFNVRGIEELPTKEEIDGEKGYKATAESPFYDKTTGIRGLLTYNEETKLLTEGNFLENVMGVFKVRASNSNQIIGINFQVPKEVVEYLRDVLGIKGWFFVRQKRIPTTLCQAYMIAVDAQSNTPVLKSATIGYYKGKRTGKYITESFLSQIKVDGEMCKLLTHNFSERLIGLKPSEIRKQAAICPEYDVNSPYLNNIFTGQEMALRVPNKTTNLSKQSNERHYAINPNCKWEYSDNYKTVKIIGVEDNVKLVAINDNMFSARAGEAEEAFRFEYAGAENKNTDGTNIIRGSYGPYIGIVGYEEESQLVDIKIPGYASYNTEQYFKIRYQDKSPYYAISERIDISRSEFNNWYGPEDRGNYNLLTPVYRGDCYICQFTHRLNRNFQDPAAPINDDIVDEKCWKENYKVKDGVLQKDKFDKINLGDVNAIGLGIWITFSVRSTMNLCIRNINDSIPDEKALTGHDRGFFPFYPMSIKGSYKVPEALCFNKGFEKSLSERINIEVPDVPWIKNEFSNRIAYSDIQVVDGFRNGFRTFQGTHYRDYPKTYGSITKIVELKGDLLVVFEHGVGLVAINERVLSGEGNGGYVYINPSNVLAENPKILSDTFGSQWRESIIKTDTGVYGVDTVGKKIWKTNGDTFECISDFKVQEFLNNNISLTERELDPIIGVRNVKSHYNKYKHDVMFTFYDNLYGFEEKVWNLCWNEIRNSFVTFYSWVPSYSENIYNQYFSFDRNTSKWITKLGVSKTGNDFSDGITLEDNVIYGNSFSAKLNLSNRTLPSGTNVEPEITYTLERDNWGNYKYFTIEGGELKSKPGVKCTDFNSEFYERTEEGKIAKDDKGRRKWLPRDKQKNPDKVVIYLNIRANVSARYIGEDTTPDIVEAYQQDYKNGTTVNAGYYESVVALIPEYNMQFLTTDFWRHGQAGIIDISDKLYPTYWYGKQHPFEFEFVVADQPQLHKIFDNLEIISNNAEPESFHYEIIGDCFDFAKDKKNMYIRQEATKELYQYNGMDITYDHDYSDLESVQRPIKDMQGNPTEVYDKSTILPLYYSRQDTINEIEDYYHLKDGSPTKDFSALAGGEITRYENLDEYRIWNHTKAVDLREKGRLRGNMQYKEDRWNVQINPINIVQRNEPEWGTEDISNHACSNAKVPIELKQSPIPDQILEKETVEVKGSDRAITLWPDSKCRIGEVKLKDKWIKIRIRYTGDNLAIISAIRTFYSISSS